VVILLPGSRALMIQGLFTPIKLDVEEDRKQLPSPIEMKAVRAFLNLAIPKKFVPLPILIPLRRASGKVYRVHIQALAFQ
jgi:hypothetical protein